MAINYYVGERVPLYQGLTQAYARGLEGIAQESQRGAEMQYSGVKDITDAIESNKKQQQDAMFRNEQNKIAREKLALDKETFYAGQADKKEMQTQKLEMDKLMQQNALNTQTEWKNLDVATQMALKAMGITSQMQLQEARLNVQKEVAGMNITSREKIAGDDRNLKKEMQEIQLGYSWDIATMKEDALDDRLLMRLNKEDSWKRMDNKIKSDVFLLDQEKFKEIKRQNIRSNALKNRNLNLSEQQIQNNYSIAQQNIGIRRKTNSLMTKEFNEYKKPLLEFQKEKFTAERADRVFAEENKNLVGMVKSWNQAIHTEWVRESNQAIANKTTPPTKQEVAQKFFKDRNINIEDYKERRSWLNFSNDIESMYPEGGMSNLSQDQIEKLYEDYKKGLTVSETSYGIPLFDGDFSDAFNQKIQQQTLDLKERQLLQSDRIAKDRLSEEIRQFNIGNETQKDQFARTMIYNIKQLDLKRDESVARIEQSADDLNMRRRQLDQQLVDLAGISGLSSEQLAAFEKPVSEGGLGLNPKGKTLRERQLAVQENQSEKLLANSKKSLIMASAKIRSDLKKEGSTDTKNLIKIFGDIPSYMNFREKYLYRGRTPDEIEAEFQNKYYYALSPESRAEQVNLRPMDEEELSFSTEELAIFKELGRYDEEGISYDQKSKGQALEMYINMKKRSAKEMADFPPINAQQLMSDLGLNRLTQELDETEELIFNPKNTENEEDSRGNLELLEDIDDDLQSQVNTVLNRGENETFDPETDLINNTAQAGEIQGIETPEVGQDLAQQIMTYDRSASILEGFGTEDELPKEGDENYTTYEVEPPVQQLATVQNLTKVAGGADKYISVIKEANELLGTPDGPMMDLDGRPLSEGMKQALTFGAENNNQIDLSKVEGLKGLSENYTLDTSQSGISPDLIIREINSDLDRADPMTNPSPTNVIPRKAAFKEAVIGFLLLSNMYEEGSEEQLSAQASAIQYANKFKDPLYAPVRD